MRSQARKNVDEYKNFPINSLSSFADLYGSLISEAVSKVAKSGWYVLGPEVDAFESQFAAYLNADHCIGVANGTDAIEIALRSVGCEKGNHIATVANAGMYSSTAIHAIQGVPFYLDVDINTHCTTLSEVMKAVAADVKAIIITHLYGRIAPDIEHIAAICKARGVALIEDCAQAHGAKLDGKHAGTFGDAASFSFYPTKNLGCIGDGGCVVTNSEQIASTCIKIRQYGWESKYQVCLQGGRNSRLDEIQAAVLSVLLPELNHRNSRRQEIAEIYSNEINHPDVTVAPKGGEDFVAHLYVIRTQNRTGLQEHLKSNGVQTDIHYPIPDHLQSGVPTSREWNLPVTEKLAQEILTLPCYPEMDNQDASSIAKAVNTWMP